MASPSTYFPPSSIAPGMTETEWNSRATVLTKELTTATAELRSGHTASVGSFEELLRDKVRRIVIFANNTLFLYDYHMLIKEPTAIIPLAYTHMMLENSVKAAEEVLTATAPKDPMEAWFALALGDTSFVDNALKDCEAMLKELEKK